MTQINQLRSQTVVDRSKKTALILVLLVTVMTSFSFANGAASFTSRAASFASSTAGSTKGTNRKTVAMSADGITRRISTSFRQDFKSAEFISSEAHSKFTKLTFRVNDVVLSAFYAQNGKLIAVIRNILSSQLPINLMMDLKKSYSDYWISELFELNSDGQTCYYVSLENADTKLVLRSNSDNTWDIYQETDKN